MPEEKEKSGKPDQDKPLRFWPGIVIVLVQFFLRFGLVALVPSAFGIGIFGGMLCWVAVVVWWALFSRAAKPDRWLGIGLMIVALLTAWLLKHDSLGPLWFVGHVVPFLTLAFVAWTVFTRRTAPKPRRWALVVVLLLVTGAWMLIRTGGVTGDYRQTFAWRWTASSEEQLLDQAGGVSDISPSALESEATIAEWPGFRGPARNGIVHGVRIETDWRASPPVELWRRSVGPGWSSFAVQGDRFFTQEQRGENESVSCYSMTTGESVWFHRDEARFFESNAGAGPRGTPALAGGRVFTLGATGILNALDAADGSVLWSRNAADDTETKVPFWGFSGSPAVVDNTVIVSVAGSLIAYDASTGEPRWSIPAGGDCYSSPHPTTLNGVAQILLLNEAGASGMAPENGTVLWEHAWEGNPIVQPALIEDGDLLISVGERSGLRRIAVAGGTDGWTTEERWTSVRMKPNFNDLVVHGTCAYGFDSRVLACIGLEDGERKWKGGRYGNGQLILLEDQDLLIVISEKGELALVRAVPDGFTELARFPAVEGKTWNHPVLVGDVLLVRNDREMAAFRLALADD